ncbi:hypothetical protein TWF102_000485 [Orbilia oligospora]|uniref:Uncharacterized protein n=1 Tax=Orbilia oligospora TaxID=2813651 RepID=A0A7C8J1Y7_ORBOL|nr:hypothetical protein TWF102_000485 [Orbilia oligospora]KAF3097125.1 hypothetical protein TWF103_009646 [Orbilia oligospora]KAF3117075.1 hypothetical protein TWF706_000281 [Orbilia oligospora]KAF3126807.1 hypothetical protein TWF703_010293 [Orbilia oligospora]
MTSLPSATRPLTRLAQSSLITRSNAIQSLCYRCQVLALKDSPAQLFVAGQSQRRYLNIRWGTKEHIPGVKVRKGKRQRLIEAGKTTSMGAPQLTTDELKDTYAPELFVFRSDIASGNINAAMQSLTNLIELDILRHSDSHNLAQALHESFRSKSLPKATVIKYISMVFDYLKSGQLPKHYLAHVHILSTLKEAEEWTLGNEYWNWLKDQNLDHLNARVFGAVIEFLAYQGAPLEDLENLYSLALEKFSKAEDAGGGMHHRATSLTLVQGIITARILNQNWRSAYEALDIVARLHPTQVPTRIYELFIHNRPSREGYLVFLMACRAGTRLNGKSLMWIISNWWKETMDEKGVLQLVLAYLAIGGKASVILLNKVIFGLLGRLPEAPEPPAPLGTLIKSELEGADERTAEEKEKESKEWEEWEKKMEEYQAAVNPMFGTIRRTIELFDGVNVEPDIITYCNIISQAARRHLRQIVAAAMREIDSTVRSGKGILDEAPYRVIMGACGSLADQEGVKKSWEGLVEWRKKYLEETMKAKYQPGRVWTGITKEGARDHELMSWKALIRAGFEAGMKPYILEQLNKYQNQFSQRLTSEIRLELVRREGSLQKSLKNEAEMLAAAVKTGKDSIDTSSNPLRKQSRIISTGVPETSYAELRAEVEEYNKILDVIEKVIRSTVAYDFSTLDLDLGSLGVPEMTEDDVGQLREVYEHFQKNMPRNPWLTATHDPKTDLAGLQLANEKKNSSQGEIKEGEEVKEGEATEVEAKEEDMRNPEVKTGGKGKSEIDDGAWGERRSVTGYSINQLRFENWITMNRLLYLAEKGATWREKGGGGVKGVVQSFNRREVKAKAVIKEVEGLEGRQWEEEVLSLRASLALIGGKSGAQTSEVD